MRKGKVAAPIRGLLVGTGDGFRDEPERDVLGVPRIPGPRFARAARIQRPMTCEYHSQRSDLQEGGSHECGDDVGKDAARTDGLI